MTYFTEPEEKRKMKATQACSECNLLELCVMHCHWRVLFWKMTTCKDKIRKTNATKIKEKHTQNESNENPKKNTQNGRNKIKKNIIVIFADFVTFVLWKHDFWFSVRSSYMKNVFLIFVTFVSCNFWFGYFFSFGAFVLWFLSVFIARQQWHEAGHVRVHILHAAETPE